MDTATTPPTQFAVALREQGLAAQSSQQLQDAFAPLFEQAEEWARKVPLIAITDATQVREMKLARETRLALRDIRMKAENTRKALGEDARQFVKAVNFIYNLLAGQIEPMESRLLEQEKFVERKEAERKAALAETRKTALAVFGLDTAFYNLGEMEEAAYVQLHDNTRLAHEAKIEAARRIEADRIAKEAAELAERERIKAENERLRKEAAEATERDRLLKEKLAIEVAEREACLKAERELAAKEKADADAKAAKELADAQAKAKAELDALDAAARAEREAIERKAREDAAYAAAKAKADAEEIQRKADAETARVNEANRQERLRLQALADVERVKAETAAATAKAEKDALEAKLAQERAAAAKAEVDRVAAAKAIEDARIAALVKAERDREAANKAPDTEKLMALATTIRGLVLPELLSEAGKAIAPQVNSQLEKFAAWVEAKAKGLG